MYIKNRLGKSSFKTLIFYSSRTGNTKDIVQHMAEVLEADISDINNIANPDISKYDVIGFASGIYNGDIDARMKEVMQTLEFRDDQYTFLAVTHAKSLSERYVKSLENILKDKGVYFLGSTEALGEDREGNVGFSGRGARKHPNDKDYYRVENFGVDCIWLVNRMLGNTELEEEITATSDRLTKMPIDITGAMPKFMRGQRLDE